MPVKIQELHIRVTVNPPGGSNGEARAGSSVRPSGSTSGGVNGKDKQALIAECLEQVSEVNKRKKER